MGKIETYFEIGFLSKSITETIGIENLPIMMKHEYNRSIRNGQIYKELTRRENDYIYFEESYFSVFVEYPHQIRKSRNDTILLIRSSDSYYSNGLKHDTESYALRLVQSTDNDDKPCWEAIEFDIYYTPKQNDTIVWQCK